MQLNHQNHLDLVTRFINSYRYVGAPSPDVPPIFLYHASRELVHPSLTPCFLRPYAAPTTSMLSDLAEVVPFFSVVDGPWCEMSAVRAIAGEAGWVQKYRVISVEFLTTVTDAAEVDEYLFDVGDAHAEPSLIARTNHLGEEVFGMPPDMAAALTTIAKTAEDKVYAVIARESDGGDVAAGLAFCRDRTAFLAGGAVRVQHRRRGLWHQLLRRRQLLTAAAGADRWIYTTVNPHLVGQGDVRMDLITFAKDEG